MPHILFLHSSEQKMLSIIVAVVPVILVGLVIKGYNPELNIWSTKCFDSVCSSQCNRSILKSPHMYTTLLVRFPSIYDKFSLNLLMLVFGALYIQPTLIFECLLICSSIKILSKHSSIAHDTFRRHILGDSQFLSRDSHTNMATPPPVLLFLELQYNL